MESVTLPAKVRSKACYQQLLGAVAMEPHALDTIIATVRQIGLESIWKSNEAKGEYPLFSPAIHHVAELLGNLGLEVHLANPAQVPNQGNSGGSPEGPPPYALYNGTAIIPIAGPLSKMPTSLGHMFGGSSTVGMRKALGMALADKRVLRIMFHVDSPGGTVAGTGDLADEIHAARAVKPVAAYIEDLGASAAYWLASQTSAIYASPHAQVGSIGVITTVYDSSEAAKQQGVKVHVIKTAETKGGPIPGAPVTQGQLDQMQQMVDAMHRSFIESVARGRNRSPNDISAVADGRVHLGAAALKLGLVDALGSFRVALTDFQRTGNPIGGAQPATPPRQGPGRVLPTEPYNKASSAVIHRITITATTGDSTTMPTAQSYTGQALAVDELVVLRAAETAPKEKDLEEGTPAEGVDEDDSEQKEAEEDLQNPPRTTKKEPTEMDKERDRQAGKPADAPPSQVEDGDSNTPDSLLGAGDTMSPDKPTSAGSPPAGAPSPEAYAALLRDVEALKAQVSKDAALTLDGEKERILAAYAGIVSKEAIAKVTDIAGLQAVEMVARAAKGSRTAADPAAGKDYAAFPDAAARAAAASANLPDATASLEANLLKQYGIVPSMGSKSAAPAARPAGGA